MTAGWFQRFDFSRIELLLVRAGLALVVWFAYPDRVDYAEQPDPVGLARFGLDFTWLSHPSTLEIGRWILLAACLLFVSGWRPVLATGLLLFFTIAHGTLDNSQGAATHHLQIVGLVCLAQFAAYLWSGFRRLSDGHARATWWSIQTIAATYLVTALTKVFASGLFGWISKARHYPLQLEKTRLSEYHNRLGIQPGQKESPSLGDRWDGLLSTLGKPVTEAFLSSPLLCQIALATGLCLEFAAVLGLARRSWAAVIGLGLISLHLAISAIMDLDFRWNMALLFVFFVNLPGLVRCAMNRFRRTDPSIEIS